VTAQKKVFHGCLMIAPRRPVAGTRAMPVRARCARVLSAATALLATCCNLACLTPVACVGGGGVSPGGHFRDGSLAWTKLEGNTVEFEMLTSWKRSHAGHYVDGAPAHGKIYLGDHVTVGGQVPPKLDFGDGAFQYMVVEVTSFSEDGDWFSGISYFTHTYKTPNNGWRIDVDRYGDSSTTQGAPWEAAFSGCCRWDQLVNEANQPFQLKAVFDLVRMTGSPGARSLEFSTPCETAAGGTMECLIPGSGEGKFGPCAKVPFTTIECGNAASLMGKPGGFLAVPAEPKVDGIIVESDGTVRTPPSTGACLSVGQRSAGISVRDGTVGFINIKNPGTNCIASGSLQVSGGAGLPGKLNAAATFESENGKLKRIVITNGGANYLSMPAVSVPTNAQFPCTGYELEVIAFETTVNIMVGSMKRHSNDCFDAMNANQPALCKPTLIDTDVKYTGTVIPQFTVGGFPFIGWGWNAEEKRPMPPAADPFEEFQINGGTGKQDAYSHAVAYAGYDLSLTFNASVNWCQLSNMYVPEEFIEDPRCVVKGSTVSFKYGPLPRNVRFSMHQEDAITDLMITYDNPFEAHRPQHEWAMNKMARDYVNHPNSVQAAQLGFTRIDFNLNSGVGGASVYLWYKRYDPTAGVKPGEEAHVEAITHLNVSTSPEEEAQFHNEGYIKLDGNLNEAAGGSDVFIWYKKASGHVSYQANRPAQMGMENAITNISFVSEKTPYQDLTALTANDGNDQNSYYGGVQSGPGWVKVKNSLNAGTVSNNPIFLYWKRSHTNPTSQTLTWRPCKCDVGRQYICVAPQTSQKDAPDLDRVVGEQRCIAIDVQPDRVPEWHSPGPDQVLEFFIGRETRYPITVMLLNPDKQVNIEAELPPGAALDVMTSPAADCTDIGLCYARSRDLAWTPAWNQGGLTSRVCFKASDILTGCEPDGQLHESQVCATLLVHKCVYAINFEQHLQEVASLYHTDWLNVYSMNPTIKTPDRVLYAGQLINIGHLYHVVPGDTVSRIAQVRASEGHFNITWPFICVLASRDLRFPIDH